MKYLPMLLLALVIAWQEANAKTLLLEEVIEHALQNSPETARIYRDLAEARAEAFEIEGLDNPTAEIDTTALTDEGTRSLSIEVEQPLRLSNFGSRRVYADAVRRTANIEQKAQMLELIHSVMRSYAAYWALQEQERFVSDNAVYARQKQKLVEEAAQEGRVDASEAKIFQAEALRLEEQLRTLSARRKNGAVNLLQMAGMDQHYFLAEQPVSPTIPELAFFTTLADNTTGARHLLESRKTLAERRYQVARRDAGFPEFAPRAVIERDFDDDRTAVLFGLNITIPIWDRNQAELSRAKAERQLAQRNLTALNQQNFTSILAAAREEAAAFQISASKYRKKILPLWRDVQAISDKKFESGQISVLALFQMRERLTEVRRDALQTDLASIEALTILESLIGQPLAGVGGKP